MKSYNSNRLTTESVAETMMLNITNKISLNLTRMGVFLRLDNSPAKNIYRKKKQ